MPNRIYLFYFGVLCSSSVRMASLSESPWPWSPGGSITICGAALALAVACLYAFKLSRSLSRVSDANLDVSKLESPSEADGVSDRFDWACELDLESNLWTEIDIEIYLSFNIILTSAFIFNM